MQYLKYLPTITYNMKKQSLRASDVYDVLVQIPEGKVTTYGDIARALGQLLNKEGLCFIGDNTADFAKCRIALKKLG